MSSSPRPSSPPSRRRPSPLTLGLGGALLSLAVVAPAAYGDTTTPAPAPTTTASGAGTATTAAPAGYRFWGYYHRSGTTWAFAETGPDQYTPKDGAVEGWRYATAGIPSRAPRAAPSFEDVCAKTSAEAGKIRVAVVVDFGRKADAETPDPAPPAPVARCVLVADKASGSQVLAEAMSGQVRLEKGMVCGIDGWPASGCGGPVATLSAAAAAPDDTVDISVRAAQQPAPPAAPAAGVDQGPSSKVTTGIALFIVAAAGAAAYLVRRRRQASAGAGSTADRDPGRS